MNGRSAATPVGALDDRSIVGRLRVRSASRLDANTARARLESVLSGEALRVAGLPPTAILCIRSMRDPLPEALRLDRQAGVSSAWQAALARALEREARSAARPLEGSVPAGATAVIFHDRSELLACLARDWTRGEIGALWWWRHLVRWPAATIRVAPAQWRLEPRYVPAAARRLADRGALVAFAAALDEVEARDLVASVAESFGIHLAPRESTGAAPLETTVRPLGDALQEPPLNDRRHLLH